MLTPYKPPRPHEITRRTFAAGTALTAAALALPTLRAQGKLEKTKIAMSVDGKAA